MTVMHEKTPELLQLVRDLCVVEEKRIQAEGGRFNIFELLGIGTLEAETHTPYLAVLLDPHGAHGLGHKPLAAFVRRFGLNLDPATTRVVQEFPLGPVTANTGGRVDLLLTDGANRQVAIENKLYAEDQPNQLLRYKNSLSAGAKLIYLTLDRSEPSDGSIRDKKDILCLSYAEDIIAWQEDCRTLAAQHPVVRETITQYVNLLKQLTHQSTNTRMSTQIANTVLQDEASLAAYQELVNSHQKVRDAIIDKLREDCAHIGSELGLEPKFRDPLGAKEGTIGFSDSAMRDQGISIAFQFDSPNFANLFFGICLDGPGQCRCDIPRLTEGFKATFGVPGIATEKWPAWMYWHSRRNWNDDTFTAIAFGRFKPELRDKVKTLLDIVRSVQNTRVQSPLNG